MPYITSTLRKGHKSSLEALEESPPYSAGELNYLFSSISKIYLKTLGVSYGNINDIIGALEACKLELYRRTVAEYEDLKIEENGGL